MLWKQIKRFVQLDTSQMRFEMNKPGEPANLTPPLKLTDDLTHRVGIHCAFYAQFNDGLLPCGDGTVALQKPWFCHPAAHWRTDASVSVPVQSYRSEGSQALCLVSPWESPRSGLVSENRNTDSIGRSASKGGADRRVGVVRGSTNPTYQGDSQAGAPAMTSPGSGRRAKEKRKWVTVR